MQGRLQNIREASIHPALQFVLALLPIATVFVLLVVLEWSAKLSMLVAYVVTALTALLLWGPISPRSWEPPRTGSSR